MATNKLMEAAAEVLAASKKSAPAMPPQKLEGEVVDLGGPTPQNSKPDDDSNKIHATKAAKSATAPTTKPSAASGKVVDHLKKEEEEDSFEDDEYLEEEEEQLDELSKDTLKSYKTKATKSVEGMRTDWEKERDKDRSSERKMNKLEKNMEKRSEKVQGARDRLAGAMRLGKRDRPITKGGWSYEKIKGYKAEEVESDSNEDFYFQEDINALFADDSTISEEFKAKAATIFEARVLDRVNQIQEQLETEYASMLEEAVESVKTELTEKVDDYLNYVVEQWMSDNEIAIESGLRAELTEEFIAGLRNLFAEHYIDVPAEKVDLVDELASKVEELETKLNEEIELGMQFKKALVESRKQELTREVCEGLTETQVEKIKSLAESVEFSTEEEYVSKLETIRENYFPSGTKKADETQLHETVEDGTEQKVSADPYVASVMKAISKTKI